MPLSRRFPRTVWLFTELRKRASYIIQLFELPIMGDEELEELGYDIRNLDQNQIRLLKRQLLRQSLSNQGIITPYRGSYHSYSSTLNPLSSIIELDEEDEDEDAEFRVKHATSFTSPRRSLND